MTSILVRTPNWIGDQILAYPFFHYLRKAHPSARIAVACVAWVESLQFRHLVDEVYILPKAEKKGVLDSLQALEQGAAELRAAGPWDLGISLPNSFSSAWTLLRAGAKRRRGFNTDARSLFLTEALPWKSSSTEHRSQAYLNLLPEVPRSAAVDFFGIPAANELDADTPGELTEFDAARAWPDAAPVEAPAAGSYWVLAPGSAAETRRWPIESFRELAEQIAANTKLNGVIVGGLSELPLAQELVQDPSLRLVDLTAQGPPTSLWKIFKGARFTVSNDSGLAHVASLCGSPVQIVWGAGVPARTRPLGPGRARVIFNPIECWPCEENQCGLPAARKIECLRGISSGTVWKEIQSGFLQK
jgi:heptosyltransferase-2